MKLATAVLIAVIAGTGAFCTWQAEVAGARAEQATEQGIVSSIAVRGEQLEDRAEAAADADAAAQTDQLLAERAELDAERDPVRNPLPASVARHLSLDYWVSAATGEWASQADAFAQHYETVRGTRVGRTVTFNVDQRANDLFQESLVRDDETSSRTAARAEDQRYSLLVVNVVLAFALGLATVSQLTRLPVAGVWAGAGTALLLAAVVRLLMLET